MSSRFLNLWAPLCLAAALAACGSSGASDDGAFPDVADDRGIDTAATDPTGEDTTPAAEVAPDLSLPDLADDAAADAGGDPGPCTGECVPQDKGQCGPDGIRYCLPNCTWGKCECNGPLSQDCTCPNGTGRQTRPCINGDTFGEWGDCTCPGEGAWVDISARQGENSGWYPSIAIDAKNRKILVVTANRSTWTAPYLFRCDLDGTGCLALALSMDYDSGIQSSFALDAGADRILVASQYDTVDGWGYAAGQLPMLYRCNSDGTGCASTLISPMHLSGKYPSAAFDPGVGFLFVATTHGDAGNRPFLFTCASASGSCNSYDMAPSAGKDAGLFPSIALDTVHGRVYVATKDGSNGNRPGLFHCGYDGQNCAYNDISAGQGPGSGLYGSAVVDEAGGKVLVVTLNGSNNGREALFRCGLDGKGCTHTDLSAGLSTGAADIGKALVDTVNGKLLVVTSTGDRKPGLLRCNLDGTGCTFRDASAGRPASSGFQVSAAIDYENGKVVIVANDGSNGYRPSLFFTDL